MMDEWMLDNLLRSVQQLNISGNQTVPTNGSTSVEAAAAVNIQQSVNMQTLSGPNESGQPGVIGGENILANSLPSYLQIKCTPMQATKEWHLYITPEFRNYIIHTVSSEIYQAVLPFPNSLPEAMINDRMRLLVAYATKFEGVTYEMANSQKEYYYLVTEQIYMLRKKIAEKRRIKERQKLQAQQQQQQQEQQQQQQEQQQQPPGTYGLD